MADHPDVVCAVLRADDAAADRLLARFAAAELSPPTAGRAAIVRRRRLAHALMRDLLLREIGEGAWSVVTGENGKPFVAGLPAETEVDISLTHGGVHVAVAISRIGAIGLDIEPHRRDRDHAGIARYGFGVLEQQVVAAAGAPSFYRVWTLREAMGKATGEGLALATDGADRIPPLPTEGTWTQDGGRWLLLHRYLQDSSLAIAIQPRAAQLAASWSSASVRWEGIG